MTAEFTSSDSLCDSGNPEFPCVPQFLQLLQRKSPIVTSPQRTSEWWMSENIARYDFFGQWKQRGEDFSCSLRSLGRKSESWGGGGAIQQEPRVLQEGRVQSPQPVWFDSEAWVAPNQAHDSKASKVTKKNKALFSRNYIHIWEIGGYNRAWGQGSTRRHKRWWWGGWFQPSIWFGLVWARCLLGEIKDTLAGNTMEGQGVCESGNWVGLGIAVSWDAYKGAWISVLPLMFLKCSQRTNIGSQATP